MTERKWVLPEDVMDLQAITIEKDGGLAGGLTRPDLLETAFLTAAQFLLDNGVQPQRAKATEHADMMVSFTEGKISREDAAAHFERHSAQERGRDLS